ALVAAAALVQLGCHHSSSFGIFTEDAGGTTGSPGASGATGDPGSSGPTDLECTEGQIVMCIHDPGAPSCHAACVDTGDVLSQIYDHGDYEGPCVENELRICHQEPNLPIPRARWIPANHWLLHQTHTNGLPGPALRYDRMLGPSESCMFGLDY